MSIKNGVTIGKIDIFIGVANFLNFLQAMECQVAGVVPIVDSWSTECCMTVRQLLGGKTLTIKLVDTLKNGRVHTVDIQLSIGW